LACGWTEHRGPLRRHAWRGSNRLNCPHLVRLNSNSRLLHRTCAGQRVLRNCHCRSRHSAIRVRCDRYGSGLHVGVIGIRDLNIVDHRGIGRVDPGYIRRAGPVRRNVHISRTQWKPANIAAKPERESCSAAEAEPRNQGWSVDRTHADGPGDPAPTFVEERPASIVKGRKPPRLVIHPGPSPRFDPDPVTEVIWRPA
jgi:hypothetical protein